MYFSGVHFSGFAPLVERKGGEFGFEGVREGKREREERDSGGIFNCLSLSRLGQQRTLIVLCSAFSFSSCVRVFVTPAFSS